MYKLMTATRNCRNSGKEIRDKFAKFKNIKVTSVCQKGKKN